MSVFEYKEDASRNIQEDPRRLIGWEVRGGGKALQVIHINVMAKAVKINGLCLALERNEQRDKNHMGPFLLFFQKAAVFWKIKTEQVTGERGETKLSDSLACKAKEKLE